MTATALSDRNPSVVTDALTVEPPKRKRGRPRKTTTEELTIVLAEPSWEPDENQRTELVADCAFAIAAGFDLEEYVFDSWSAMTKTTKAAIIRDAKKAAPTTKARLDADGAEREASQRQAIADAARAKAEAERKPCKTCGALLPAGTATYENKCDDCEAKERAENNARYAAEQAEQQAYEARMSDWTLAAYNRADALYSEIGSDQDRLVLMLAKEIAGWEGVRHYDAHRLADKATKHAIAQAKAPTPKGTTPRGTTPRGMHPAHGAMYWKVVAWLRTTDPKKVSRLDEAVLHALLAHYNGKSGQCNPGSKTLAAEVRATRTTVLKSVKRLETCGAISIDDHDHDGRSFAYSFKLG